MERDIVVKRLENYEDLSNQEKAELWDELSKGELLPNGKEQAYYYIGQRYFKAHETGKDPDLTGYNVDTFVVGTLKDLKNHTPNTPFEQIIDDMEVTEVHKGTISQEGGDRG